jgi:hypothetical protein
MERLSSAPLDSPQQEPWQVINRSELTIGFDYFSSLSRYANFYNAGDVYCQIYDQTPSLVLGSLYNDGSITFKASRDGLNPLSQLNLTIQSLKNEGEINFVTLAAAPTPIPQFTWNIGVTKVLENLGALLSDDTLALENLSDQDFSLEGYVASNGLILNNINTIRAVLVSGYHALAPDQKGTTSESGFLHVKSNSTTTPFSWDGLVYTTGATTLNLASESPQVTKTKVGAYFDTKGFETSVNSPGESHISFEQDPVSVATIMSNPLIDIRDYLINIYTQDFSGISSIGKDGFKVSFNNEGTNPRGSIDILGIYDVQGPIAVQHSKKVSLQKDGVFIFGNSVGMDTEELTVDGSLLKNQDYTNPDYEFSTQATITVGAKGILETGRMVVPVLSPSHPAQQKLVNHGSTQIEGLFQLGKLTVHNDGNFTVLRNAGGIHPHLFIEDNKGTVHSALSVSSFYTPGYFKTNSRIEGSIQSEKDIQTKFSKSQTGAVNWEQSLRANGPITVNAQATDLTLKKADTKWQSIGGFIKVNGKGLDVAEGVDLYALHSIGLFFDPHEGKIQFNGSLKTPDIFFKSHKLTGQGQLGVHNATLDAYTPRPFDFKWGEDLSNLTLRSMGKITLEDKRTNAKEFRLGGRLTINGDKVDVITPIKAQHGIKMNTTATSESSIEVGANLVSPKGNVLLQGSAVKLPKDKKIRVVGINVIIDDQKSSSLELPKSSRIKAQEKVVVINPTNISIHAQASGKQLLAKSKTVFVNSITKQPLKNKPGAKAAFSGFSEGIYVEGSVLRSSVPITTGILEGKLGALLVNDVDTTAYDLEARFAALEKATWSNTAPSHLRSDDLQAKGATIRTHGSSLTLSAGPGAQESGGKKKGVHSLVNVDASQANIVQEVGNLVIGGKTSIGSLAANHTTTVAQGSSVRIDSIRTSKDQQAFNFFEPVTIKEDNVHLKAKTVKINGLKHEGDEPFNTLIIEGGEGEIQGTYKTNLGLLRFDRDLRLHQAHIMANVFDILTKNVTATESSLEADESSVVTRGGKADLRGLTVNSQDHFTLKADKAKLNPALITTDVADIHLQKYHNGIKGIIKLAHDLVHCQSVRFDAKKETLTIDQPTEWRPNIALAVNKVDIQESLSSLGAIDLESETGIEVAKSLMARSLSLLAKKDDIRFYRALVRATKDMKIKAEEGSVKATASELLAEKGNLEVEAGLDAVLESIAVRTGNGENYADQKVACRTAAGQDTSIITGRHILLKGVETKSGKNTRFVAGHSIVDAPLSLESQSVWRSDKDYSRHKYTHQDVSQHKAGGTFTSLAKEGSQELYAPKIEAQKTTLLSQNGVHLHEVHYIRENEFKSHKEGDLFKQSKTVHGSSISACSKGACITGTEPTEITSGGDITLTNVTSRVPKTILTTVDGVVRILLGTNQYSSSRTVESSNAFWQKHGYRNEKHNTFTQPTSTAVYEIHSKEVIVESVRGQTSDIIKRIEIEGGKITHSIVDELHHVDAKTVQGPTKALAAVVALAVTIATNGAASHLGAMMASGMTGVTATVVSGMTATAFTSVCSQAALALLANEGDLGKAAKSLASTASLKSLLADVVTTGLVGSGGSQAGLSFSQRLVANSVRSTVRAGVSSAIENRNIGELLKDGGINALVDSISGSLAQCIGEAAGSLHPVEHKVLHFGLGAAIGAAKDRDNPLTSALIAGTAAMMAEVVGETLVDREQLQIEVLKKMDREGRPITFESFNSAYQQQLRPYIDVTRLVVASAIAGMGHDPSVAITAATNALENNFVMVAYPAYYGLVALLAIAAVDQKINGEARAKHIKHFLENDDSSNAVEGNTASSAASGAPPPEDWEPKRGSPKSQEKQTTSFERAITKEDLGKYRGGVLKELQGSVRFESNTKTYTIRIDNIVSVGGNPRAVVRNFVKSAQEHGANTLKIEGTIANTDLLSFVQKHYNARTMGANEIITIPLR